MSGFPCGTGPEDTAPYDNEVVLCIGERINIAL